MAATVASRGHATQSLGPPHQATAGDMQRALPQHPAAERRVAAEDLPPQREGVGALPSRLGLAGGMIRRQQEAAASPPPQPLDSARLAAPSPAPKASAGMLASSLVVKIVSAVRDQQVVQRGRHGKGEQLVDQQDEVAP